MAYMKVDENWNGCFNQRTNLLGIDPVVGESKDRVFMHEIVHLIDLNYLYYQLR